MASVIALAHGATPSRKPSKAPLTPTQRPTSFIPSLDPTEVPTQHPSEEPTERPSTFTPTAEPSISLEPTISLEPSTFIPTFEPTTTSPSTIIPTEQPTTYTPSIVPSIAPTSSGNFYYNVTKEGVLLRDGIPWQATRGAKAFHINIPATDYTYHLLRRWGIHTVQEFIENLNETPISGPPTNVSTGEWLHSLQSVVDANRHNGLVTILSPIGWVLPGARQVQMTGMYPTQQSYYNDYKARMKLIAAQFVNQSDVWLECWHEPYPFDNSGDYTDDVWLSDAVDMVQNLRSVPGFNNIIVVQSSGQGQNLEALFNRGTSLTYIFPNILFQVHQYEDWMRNINSTQVQSQINQLQDLALPLLIQRRAHPVGSRRA